jgi:K+-sensing histidine kinase KdpD
MINIKKYRLKIVTTGFWILLLYVIAALAFWFIELNSQNKYVESLKLTSLKKDDPQYEYKFNKIKDEHNRKTAQYIGEGATFLVLILVGAVFVYRSVKKQIVLSHQQQNFMMAVTHELKTPIAVTQLNLQTLQKRKLEPEKQQQLINNTLQEANRLNILCNNILLASQLEADVYSSDKEEIDLSELVKGSVADFVTRYPSKKIQSNIAEDIYINGEDFLLQMLVNNLIENAIKYAPQQPEIFIALEQTNNKITLQVKDNGVGIADNEKKKVFDKFYRIGDESTRNTKGTGLGLYLCKKIVKKHKGNISVINNQPAGSIFTATFHV